MAEGVDHIPAELGSEQALTEFLNERSREKLQVAKNQLLLETPC